MNPQQRAVGVAVLVGFLSCTAWSAGLVPPPRCSASSSDPCPIVSCKSTAANSSPKADVAQALLPASFVQLQHPHAAAPIATLAQIPAFLPPEFRRPMRN